MSDSYLGIIEEQWENILSLYKQFEDKKPIMLFDIQEETVYAYPYEDFKTELDRKSARSLEEQYERALAKNYVVVFVKDNEQGNLVSYSLDLEPENQGE